MTTENQAPEGADERSAFEAHFKHLDLDYSFDEWQGRIVYRHDHIDCLWEGWQARAALAAQPQAAPVAWCQLALDGKHIAYFDGKPMVMPGPVGNDCHPHPLYVGAAPAPCAAEAHGAERDPNSIFQTDGLPERDTSKPADQQGLFRKFVVTRTDGSDKPGGKHENCEYFVLDVGHDRHAAAALWAYAQACKDTHPDLSADLIERYELTAPNVQPKVMGGCIACEMRDAAIGQPPSQDVTPEFLTWLESKSRSAGVAANEAWNAGVAWARSQAPAPAPEHVPVSPELEADLDDKLGLVLLPPIRVNKSTYEALAEECAHTGLIMQAVVRGALADAVAAQAPAVAHPKAAQVLDDILATLNRANESGVITDTIWHGPAETLWDFIENSRAAFAAAGEPTGAAEPQPAEFCWLVELFLGDGTGNSLGWYHTGFTDIGGNSRSTQDPLKAKRYSTWREANIASCKLGHTLQGTWRAVQHGFVSHPPVQGSGS